MEGEAAQAAGSGAFSTAVPWSQIPKFVPGETDLRVYTRKLEFLKELWPAEYLEQPGTKGGLVGRRSGFSENIEAGSGQAQAEGGREVLGRGTGRPMGASRHRRAPGHV